MYLFGDLGWRRCGFAGLCLLFVLAGCSVPKRSPVRSSTPIVAPISSGELDNNAGVFDAAWKIIYDTHYDTNFNGVNWESVRSELRPRAQAAGNRSELRQVIREMLNRLGQSHMSVIPFDAANAFDPKRATANPSSRIKKRPPHGRHRGDIAAKRKSDSSVSQNAGVKVDDREAGSGDGDIGADVRLIDGRIVVTRVDLHGPAERAGIRAGWLLKSVDGVELSERLNRLPKDMGPRKAQFLAWRMAQALLAGRPGSSVNLELLDRRNESITIELERRKPMGDLVKFGLLPAMRAHLDSGWVRSKSGARAGLIRFNLWLIPIAAPFDRAIDEFREADGIVIDLRGNLGGMAGMIMGLSGHFLTNRVSLGTMKMRANEIHFFANPRWVSAGGDRVTPFSGPVAVLVDSISLSAAEVFAGGMQSIGRARVFGETSGGQALPALWDRLPNGDVLYHAFADFVTATGVRLEGRGVVPDERRPLSRPDLIAGRDPALEAALEWIANENKKRDNTATSRSNL